MISKIQASVIGSYPIAIPGLDLMKSYFTRQEFSWEPYIKQAVFDMIHSGVTLISDGQTRDPFIQLFVRGLKGCRIRDRPEIIDAISFKKPITVPDQQYIRTIIPDKIQLLGVLTGPYTLTKSCIDLYYHDEKKAAFDFAKALNKEAKMLEDYVDMISIDEPFFSNSLPEYSHELLRVLNKDISCPVRLHVCGNVSEIVSDLLEMPVDILSHEFKASPYLFDSFKKYDIHKDICLGCVRSDDSTVESIQEIIKHIEKASTIFGEHIVQIAPDCGQRLLPGDIALKKLENLVKAGEKING
ncbi:MAG: hypothetical protein R6V50_06445 [Thermoplasmatota archaeon]